MNKCHLWKLLPSNGISTMEDRNGGIVTHLRKRLVTIRPHNVKDSIDVPAAYLEKAKGEGPFTAGVNHVIPYELFAGDGMLTRLLLKASDKAPWSDNGDAKNPALSPLGENVKTKGQYFYQVALDGNVAGKEKQALIDQFRANGTQTYSATVNVYGNKDGKPDLDNIVATKKSLLNPGET